MLSNTIINYTSDILQIYFTPAPYYLYEKASKAGNIAYVGIGQGLIHSQYMFWITNSGSVLFLYFNSKNYLFAVILAYFYFHTISKTIYLLRLCANYSRN